MLQEAKIQSGNSIYDCANILYGGFDNILTLIRLNPQFESMNVNLEPFAGGNMAYDDLCYSAKTVQIYVPVTDNKSSLITINGRTGQNIYDMCLMGYSDLDKVVKFCLDNGINSTNDQSIKPKGFNFDLSVNKNLSLYNVVKKKGYIFSTLEGFEETVEGFLLQENGFLILQENGYFIEL